MNFRSKNESLCRVPILIVILFCLNLSARCFAEEIVKRFDFGDGVVADGYTAVPSSLIYTDSNGFGFEPGAEIKGYDRDTESALLRDGCTSESPFYFSVKLPEGNYQITIDLGDANQETVTTVKAEQRRLMLENVRTKAGDFERCRFLVNVRTPQLSNGKQVQLDEREKQSEWKAWDDKLTLEFSGKAPSVCSVEVESIDSVPTLYLLGDSTVCDQPLEPYASWGQMLTAFFDSKIVVANYAHSGESLRSFRSERRLAKVLEQMHSEDWLLIQFGHNDMKSVDAAGYKAELKRFLDEIRAKGGQPIILTPMHRRTFRGNELKNSHLDFPDAARELAAEEKVALIDLHAMSQQLYEAWGPKDSVSAFSIPSDGTHHNNYGAYELAKCVVQGIRQQDVSLAKFIRSNVSEFNPAKPDLLSQFNIPTSSTLAADKPEGD